MALKMVKAAADVGIQVKHSINAADSKSSWQLRASDESYSRNALCPTSHVCPQVKNATDKVVKVESLNYDDEGKVVGKLSSRKIQSGKDRTVNSPINGDYVKLQATGVFSSVAMHFPFKPSQETALVFDPFPQMYQESN